MSLAAVNHLSRHRAGFGHGETVITHHDSPQESTGIGLAVLQLAAGERHQGTTTGETAWLLMHGTVRGAIDACRVRFQARVALR